MAKNGCMVGDSVEMDGVVDLWNEISCDGAYIMNLLGLSLKWSHFLVLMLMAEKEFGLMVEPITHTVFDGVAVVVAQKKKEM